MVASNPRKSEPPTHWTGLGTGMMAGMAYQALEGTGGRFVAIGGRDAEKVNRFLERKDIRLPDIELVGSYEEILDGMQKTNELSDAVYVASIPSFHMDHTLAALRANNHVLMEKGGIGGIDQLADAVAEQVRQSNSLTFDVNSQYRHHEVFDIVRQLAYGTVADDDDDLASKLRTETIGRPRSVTIDYPQGYQADANSPVGWKGIVELAGNWKLLSDLGVHEIYTLLDVLDATFERFEGQTYNLHKTRQNQMRQTFTSNDATTPGAPFEMDMLDSEHYNGDDVAAASYVLKMQDGHRIPGIAYTSQVEGQDANYGLLLTPSERENAGKLNALALQVRFDDFTITVRQKNPNIIEITDPDGQNYREYERHSDPGPCTSPFQHPVGIVMGILRGEQKRYQAQLGGPSEIARFNYRNLEMMQQADWAVKKWGANPLRDISQYESPQMPSITK